MQISRIRRIPSLNNAITLVDLENVVIGRIQFFCTWSEQPISPSADHRRRLRGRARTIRTRSFHSHRSSQSRVNPEIAVHFTNAELRHPEQEFFIALFITLVAPISLPFWTTAPLSTPTSQVRAYAMQGMHHWQISSTKFAESVFCNLPSRTSTYDGHLFVYGAAGMREPYRHSPSSCEDNQRARGHHSFYNCKSHSVKLIRTDCRANLLACKDFLQSIEFRCYVPARGATSSKLREPSAPSKTSAEPANSVWGGHFPYQCIRRSHDPKDITLMIL